MQTTCTATVNPHWLSTGSVQTFTAPVDGIYQFELWGSPGGIVAGGAGTSGWHRTDDGWHHNGKKAYPYIGWGGYTRCYVEVSGGRVLNIVVGGSGVPLKAGVSDTGWNGGGATRTCAAGPHSASGGGMTHVSDRGLVSEEDTVAKGAGFYTDTVKGPKKDSNGNIVYNQKCDPKKDKDGNIIYQPLLDEYGDQVYDTKKDADGNVIYNQQTYEDGTPVYEQKVDAEGNLMYDEDDNPIFDETRPIYDLSSPVYDKTKPLYSDVPVRDTTKKHWKDKDGNTVVQASKPKGGTPIYDENDPVIVTVHKKGQTFEGHWDPTGVIAVAGGGGGLAGQSGIVGISIGKVPDVYTEDITIAKEVKYPADVTDPDGTVHKKGDIMYSAGQVCKKGEQKRNTKNGKLKTVTINNTNAIYYPNLWSVLKPYIGHAGATASTSGYKLFRAYNGANDGIRWTVKPTFNDYIDASGDMVAGQGYARGYGQRSSSGSGGGGGGWYGGRAPWDVPGSYASDYATCGASGQGGTGYISDLGKVLTKDYIMSNGRHPAKDYVAENAMYGGYEVVTQVNEAVKKPNGDVPGGYVRVLLMESER